MEKVNAKTILFRGPILNYEQLLKPIIFKIKSIKMSEKATCVDRHRSQHSSRRRFE